MRYWDDVQVGEAFETPGRTVTEADIVMFSGLTGDYSALHIDEEAARASIYGGRIAHGLLGLALMQGLETWVPTGIASMGSLGWTVEFRAPIHAGDTIHARFEVVAKRETRKLDRGILFVDAQLIDQKGRLLQEGQHRRMVARKLI
jgi:acyl dehydratase